MKSKKKEQVSLREAWKINYWGFLQWYRRYPMMFVTETVCQIVNALIPYVGIYLSAQLINELAGARNPGKLQQLIWIILVTTAVLALLQSVLNRWRNYHNVGDYYKRCKIYSDKMMEMDFCSLDEQHTHDLRSQVMQNERWSGWGLSRVRWAFSNLVSGTVRIIGAAALTVSLFTLPVPDNAGTFRILNSPVFIMAVVAIILFSTFLSPFFATKAADMWVGHSEDAKMGNRFFSFYGFMAKDHSRALDIRIYRQDEACNYYMKKDKSFSPKSNIAKKARGPMGAYNVLSTVVFVLFTGLVYVFVCAKAWAGAFGIGSVTQYVGAITALSGGIGTLLSSIGGMKSNAVFLRATEEYMNIPNSMYQGSLTTEKRSDRKYEVEFRDVSFRYPAAEDYALRHVNVKFQIGERMAVVGQNGSGKTTFIKLLCRLYDPTEGVILLNGIDIRKYNYQDYMSIFAVVFQDFKLLSLPLGQNVAAGMEYDEKKVRQCLLEAGFDKRLENMPEGLDTCLYRGFDDKGVEISGGEAQKIALARALYKNAPFIVLDEPTAALDPVAEYEVYMKFNEIVQDKTAIYISHRLSSCRFCDEIIVFHEGGIVQSGSHDTLVSDTKGKYYELWHAQAQYYTVETT